MVNFALELYIDLHKKGLQTNCNPLISVGAHGFEPRTLCL